MRASTPILETRMVTGGIERGRGGGKKFLPQQMEIEAGNGKKLNHEAAV